MEPLTLDKILVTVLGLLGVIFTFWFFLMKKEKEIIVTKDEVEVMVEGGYSPETIAIPFGKKTKVSFFRKDSNDCLSEVVLPDFKIRKQLPLNKKVTIEITPKTRGEFKYSCGMNMYHGRIIVK